MADNGFSVFLSALPLAAGVHLALVQEQAYTDPMHPGGFGSPFASAVQTYAQQYHDFINDTWPKVMTARTNATGGATVNYDNGYQQKVWSYSLSWSTSGGTASFDGIGNVAASGSLAFHQENSPPALPTALTVIGSYGGTKQAINWG